MTYTIDDIYIPGTVVKKSVACAIGEEFLDKIFFTTDGILLSQLRTISGIDGTTLQNWVKRGWIGTTVNKKYSKNQLARILIVNMLREVMQLEKIDFLLKYINSNIDDESDDIIPESKLFDYICKILQRLSEEKVTPEIINEAILCETSDYIESINGAYDRLTSALKIIITAYCASKVKSEALELFERIKNHERI